jgi:acyl-CoA synthetase (AMP-forming)/AMP-acid ligase II
MRNTFENSDYLELARRTSPDGVGGAAGSDRHSYADLDAAASRLGPLLPCGGRIGVVLPNGLGWAAVLSAVWRSGGEAALFPARLPTASLVEAATREQVSLLIVEDTRADEIEAAWAGPMIVTRGLTFTPRGRQWVDPDGLSCAPVSEPGVVLFTSGTTGTPKAVRLAHAALVTAVEGTIAYLTAGRATRAPSASRAASSASLIAFPLYHVSGLFLLMLALARQVPAVILERFTVSAFLDALADWPIKQIVLNPAMLTELVGCQDKRADDLVSQLALVRSGSAPLSPSLRSAFCSRFRVPLLQGYGSTETGGEVAGWTAQDFRIHGETKADSVGRAKPGVSIVIRDQADRPVAAGEIGRVAICVPWFSDDFREMGDLGYLDDDGFLFLVGRTDDVINCGGFMIHPAAVEQALELCPEIAECAVVAEADGRLGQVPVAYVVPRGEGLNTDLVEAAARTTLLPYQCPRRIYVVDALPRNDLGKIVRNMLRGAS